MKVCKNCGSEVPTNANFCVSCGSGELFDPENQVSEYKRTCNQCGKVWHSLTSREEKVQQGIRNNKSTCLCNMCDGDAENQRKQNLNTFGTEMERLKTCPQCGSSDYSELIIYHEKK
jgi:RNA polymerase subunit RPABC4/transcription elongation factor Spt4